MKHCMEINGPEPCDALGALGLSQLALGARGPWICCYPALANLFLDQGCTPALSAFAWISEFPRNGSLSIMPETSNTNNFQFAWEFQSYNPMLNNRLDASGRETGFKKK